MEINNETEDMINRVLFSTETQVPLKAGPKSVSAASQASKKSGSRCDPSDKSKAIKFVLFDTMTF